MASHPQSDIIKAYIQSDLKALDETYAELPPELAPPHLKKSVQALYKIVQEPVLMTRIGWGLVQQIDRWCMS